MAEFGRDPWRSSGPTLLLKQDHQEPGAQDHVQMAFECLQGGRLHNLSGQPLAILGHTHRVKKYFLMFRWTLLCFSLCPLPVVLSLGTTERSLALSASQPPCRYLYTLRRCPLIRLFSRLNSPSSLSPAAQETWSCCLVIFMAICWMLFSMSMSALCWGAQNWTPYSRYNLLGLLDLPQ